MHPGAPLDREPVIRGANKTAAESNTRLTRNRPSWVLYPPNDDF